MSAPPAVSAFFPCYDDAPTICGLVERVSATLDDVGLDHEVVVVDDGSTDGTGVIAAESGATVLRPDRNTGSKAGAQTFALHHVRTPFVMAIDADTVLAPDAIETLAAVFDDPTVVAASGHVLPRRVGTIWERGRYVEYLYSFTFHKPVQDVFGRPLISSGCFSMYRTEELCAVGGWSDRTMAEDMDLTWTFSERGHRVRFVPEASSYPIEPPTLGFLSKQLRRWSHGFVQNVVLHWRGLLGVPYLRSVVAVGFFDALVSPALTLIVLPVLALSVSPWFWLAYVIDLPMVALPVIVGARRRGELRRALPGLPAYFVLRLVNCWFMLGAVASELVLRRRLAVYEKGH